MSNYRPPLSLSEVPKLIMELYGIGVKVVKELESYDDRNVLVEMCDTSSPPPPPPIASRLRGDSSSLPRLLLKVHHGTFSARPDVLDLKNAMITHLTKAGYPTPALIPTIQGHQQTVIKLTDPDTRKEGQYVAKLFEFHPGITLEKICLTRDLCREVGRLTGWMDAIFMDFPINEHKGVKELNIYWNMAELSQVRTKLHFVKDKSKIPLIQEVITKCESTVLNSQESFSKGVIHSDINDANVLVVKTMVGDGCVTADGETTSNGCVEEDGYKITSIIDFGDMTYSLHVFELAIAMCYLMLNKHGVDPLDVAASVMAGYSEHVTLPDHELQHVHTCICARLVMSFIYGEVALAMDENNAEYTQTHATRCIPMLEYLWKFSGAEFLSQLRTRLK